MIRIGFILAVLILGVVSLDLVHALLKLRLESYPAVMGSLKLV